MATPTQSELYRPILEIATDSVNEDTLSHKQFGRSLIARLGLNEFDIEKERLPSGGSRFDKNMRFSVNYLKNAGLLAARRRGEYVITTEGREFLRTLEGEITTKLLLELKSQSLMQRGDSVDANQSPQESIVIEIMSESNDDVLPDDKIAEGLQQLSESLVDEMRETLEHVDPYRFEKIVVDLLVNMGYGEGEVTQRTRDGGIDGIINQDPLGLEKIYIQAKRQKNNVGEPEIHNFSGSLDTRGASKGVFITTSDFNSMATQAAKIISAGPKFIRLIAGLELASLMINHNVGVVPETTYVVKKLDENYFADDI